jgi:peroxiredoxin
LEQSRVTLERNGLWIAAVSYDSQETLQAFAKEHGVEFPLLSDRDSSVIRRFGIFNSNNCSRAANSWAALIRISKDATGGTSNAFAFRPQKRY